MATRVVNSRQQILEMGKSTQFVRPGKFMKVSYNDSLSVGWHYAIFMWKFLLACAHIFTQLILGIYQDWSA